jgi:hypothetical protein
MSGREYDSEVQQSQVRSTYLEVAGCRVDAKTSKQLLCTRRCGIILSLGLSAPDIQFMSSLEARGAMMKRDLVK